MLTPDNKNNHALAMRYDWNWKTRIRLFKRMFYTIGPSATLVAVVSTLLFLFSCTNASLDFDDAYLIRINERVVTVGNFNKAFEISKSAYPHNLAKDSVLLKEAQVRFLNQMIEELLVLQRAEELQIELTESEASREIAKIKADYPEGIFEQMLLEYAVSSSFWEKRLKVRLVMEKVIDREIYQKITLTPEEIARFYKENYEGKHQDSNKEPKKTDINKLIVKQLRRQKAEDAYQFWIKDLRGKYTVDINYSQWNRLTGL